MTCKFTNKDPTKLGTIIVEKQTVGGDGVFEFTGTASGSISDGGQIIVPDLDPAQGPYTSTETVPEGWQLTSMTPPFPRGLP